MKGDCILIVAGKIDEKSSYEKSEKVFTFAE